MKNIQKKIRKLIKALEVTGEIYIINREQFYSNKADKICSINKLFHLMPIKKYNEMYPDKKKDPNKYKYVKIEVLSTFQQQDILLKLVDIYKQVGVTNG